LKNKQRSLAKSIKLRSGRTYIIPTGFGLAFGGISFVLLVMAIGYANNLLYFFVFLLVSMGMTGMWLTNKNVDSIEVHDIFYSMIFANEKNQLSIHFNNLYEKSYLWDIDFHFEENDKMNETRTIDEIQQYMKSSIEWVPAKRGLSQLPRLVIESRFPYKMLRAWKYYRKETEILIYPERKGSSLLPTQAGNKSENELHAQAEIQGLFRDFREFQRTDSPTRIDWKRSLKHQKHLVKNFETSGEKKVLIDWEMTQSLQTFEDRVSQMALWIDICHKNHENYSMKIKEDKTSFSNVPSHYKYCMEKLAFLRFEDTL
jgi:uncharacterized protein (DUF58 family)